MQISELTNSAERLLSYLCRNSSDVLLQEYTFGVFGPYSALGASEVCSAELVRDRHFVREHVLASGVWVNITRLGDSEPPVLASTGSQNRSS